MFTGIIQELGKIRQIETVPDTTTKTPEIKDAITRLTIEAPGILSSKKKIGDSIAVDGTCLTITALTTTTFTTEAIPETLHKTIISTYREGTNVNLENPIKIGDTLDGHMTQGHVDFVGKIINIKNEGNSSILQISIINEYSKYLALKGSVAVNGVSLTVSMLQESSFEVSLIPETLKKTNLGALSAGSPVNIEIDLLARYLNRLLMDRAEQTNYEFLLERGFI